MTARRIALVPSLAAVAAVLWAGLGALPASGRCASAMAAALVRASVPERHALDVVAAVNFDFRGFDTLGEELVLFTAVVGVAMLLRRSRAEVEERPSEQEDRERGRSPPSTSGAVRTLGAGLTGFTLLFGAYVATHGHLSPGGGFQGGVLLATALLVVYLCSDVRTFTRVAPRPAAEGLEAIGAGGYAALGVAGLVVGAAYLANVLPLGRIGDVLGSGTILALNVLVAVAVAAGLVVLLTAFLEETIERRSRSER